MTSSSCPAAVMVCGMSQLAGVKVTCVGVTVTSPGSAVAASSTTSAAGSTFSTTVNWSVPPASVT